MTPTEISVAFSIGSLVLGAGAWLMGILAITASKAGTVHRNTALSFSFCTLSLLLQLFEVKNRVRIGDYSAIEDTIGAVLLAAVALTVVTIALNLIALLKAGRK